MSAVTTFMVMAADYELRRMYVSAWKTYLMAARYAENPVAEDIALTYAWWNHERAAGRVSELEKEPCDDWNG